MNTDVRLSTEFFRHPKTKKLQKRLGLESIFSLQKLWVWAAQNREDGSFAGLDHEDVALAADWDGDHEAFVGTLIELHWLDEDEEGTLSLHHWQERQPYATKSPDRVAKAKKAAEKRWQKPDGAGSDACGCPDDASGIANGCSGVSQAMPTITNHNPTREHGSLRKHTPHTPQGAAADAAGCERQDEEPPAYLNEVPLPEEEPPFPESGQAPAPRASPNRGDEPDADFFAWYNAYPRHTGKQRAIRAWRKARKQGILPPLSELLAVLEKARRFGYFQAEQYTPHPATYLNDRRWEDELKPQPDPVHRQSGGGGYMTKSEYAANRANEEGEKAKAMLRAMFNSSGAVKEQALPEGMTVDVTAAAAKQLAQ